MNLGDPELELVDPTPNVHLLFLHFDKVFFWTKLASRAVVRWSKRMYSCAGICSYDRGGLCDIALSESLLKLRPRKDLVETLLHEMIHAYLFITHRDQDRDGHGPNFKEHMHRINKAAGLNISIYHDFHDEVELYKTHWWRCNGPCHTRKPHFGIVQRSMNRAPGPTDYWWKNHQRYCGGTFVKIKEPENYGKNKKTLPKPSQDITKYINTTRKVNNKSDGVLKPVLKSSNNVPDKSNVITKSNNSSTIVVSKVNNIVFNPQIVKPPVLFSGKGKTLSGENSAKSADVVKTVRNVWAKKFLSPTSDKKDTKGKSLPKRNSFDTISINSGKHKSENEHINSPPAKIKKIDDYFKSTATTLLKDLYGEQFEIKETDGLKRLSAVPVDLNFVNCPVCTNKVSNEIINRHLDECLNKDVIEKNTDSTAPMINITPEDSKLEGISIKSSISNYIKKEHDPAPYLDIKVQMVTSTDVNCNSLGDKEYVKDVKMNPGIPSVKIEPGNSKEILRINEQRCPCCGKIVSKSINEHLDECLAFFDNDTNMPLEGSSTSFAKETIVIDDDDDDDDIFDETLTLNATGTKSPCPCCLKMIEQADMNDHLDLCLS